MDLTEEEVLQILKLIDNSSFDFLQLEWGDLKLTVSKTGQNFVVHNSDGRSFTKSPPAEASVVEAGTEGKNEPSILAPQTPRETVLGTGVPITAPIPGTFYRAAEPTVPPFAEVGDSVQEDTTVGLIEVMKVYTAVAAGVRGVILEAVAQNGQFVEYGQTLFLARPEEGSLGKDGSARVPA
jgi:biotin carboxyl carrier protein